MTRFLAVSALVLAAWPAAAMSQELTFWAKKSTGLRSLAQLDGARICLSTAAHLREVETRMANTRTGDGFSFQVMELRGLQQAVSAFQSGACTVLVTQDGQIKPSRAMRALD